MTPQTVVLLFLLLFFVIGITVGVIAVIALSAVRRDRRARFAGADPLDGDDFEEITPGAFGIPGRWDGQLRADTPRWPGDAENPAGT